MSAIVPSSIPSAPVRASISRGFGSVDISLYHGNLDSRQVVLEALLLFVEALYVGDNSPSFVDNDDDFIRFRYLRAYGGGEMAKDLVVYNHLCTLLTKDTVQVELGYR